VNAQNANPISGGQASPNAKSGKSSADFDPSVEAAIADGPPPQKQGPGGAKGNRKNQASQPVTKTGPAPSVQAPVMSAEEQGRLLELFSVEQNPGHGSLVYKQGDRTEAIEFGGVTGHYALGMVFPSESLPEPFPRQFKDSKILQMAFGTTQSHLQGQIPQFGSASLITGTLPKSATSYPLVVPSGKDKILKEIALLLFSSPSAMKEQSDEDKLKGTFFAQGGTLALSPVGQPHVVELKSQGKVLLFKAQVFRVAFDAQLVTPFNAQENALKGTLEFPVYWPHGREAEKLTQRIARESLSGLASLSVPSRQTSSDEKSDR
jgi:hypothetical protein